MPPTRVAVTPAKGSRQHLNLNQRENSYLSQAETISTRAGSPHPFCRICLSHKSPLIAPCDCIGSHGHVHNDCLKQWLFMKKTDIKHCEICGFQYSFQVDSPGCCGEFPKDRWKRASTLEKVSLVGIMLILVTGVVVFCIGRWFEEEDDYLLAVVLTVFGTGLFVPGLCLLLAVVVVLLRTDLPAWRLEKGLVHILNKPGRELPEQEGRLEEVVDDGTSRQT